VSDRPDAHSTEFATLFSSHSLVAEEDKVVKRYLVYGVHKGDFAGIPPTCKEVNISGFSLLRIDSGKIAEQWSLDDLFSFLQQIGVLSS
jgi:predicted ester cyclase